MEFEKISMPFLNSKKHRRTIMLNIKTSDPYDLKPVEITLAELDSVAGGSSIAALNSAAAAAADSAAGFGNASAIAASQAQMQSKSISR
jgi:hypothetical protein